MDKMKNTAATLGAATALMMTPMAVEAQTDNTANRLGNYAPGLDARVGLTANALLIENNNGDLDAGVEITTAPLFNGGSELGVKYVRPTSSTVNMFRESGVALGWASDANMRSMLDNVGSEMTGNYLHLHTNGPSAQLQLSTPKRGALDWTLSPYTSIDGYVFKGRYKDAASGSLPSSTGIGGRAGVTLGVGDDRFQIAIGTAMQGFYDSKDGFQNSAFGHLGLRVMFNRSRNTGCSF
jgi:hypothetical protein